MFLTGKNGIGCPEWKHWTSFWLINYIVYFFFAVGSLYAAIEEGLR
jgi:hypothetical protein